MTITIYNSVGHAIRRLQYSKSLRRECRRVLLKYCRKNKKNLALPKRFNDIISRLETGEAGSISDTSLVQLTEEILSLEKNKNE